MEKKGTQKKKKKEQLEILFSFVWNNLSCVSHWKTMTEKDGYWADINYRIGGLTKMQKVGVDYSGADGNSSIQ